MAERRFSEMPAATAMAGADIIPVVQGGTNKKVTIANLFAKVNTPVMINEAMADQDTVIRGDNDSALFSADASSDKIGIGIAVPTEKLDVVGNVKVSGILRTSGFNSQTAAGAVSLTTDTTFVASASAFAASLGDGSEGQVKNIIATNVGPITLTASNPGGWTNVTFAQNGATAQLKFINGKWYIMGSRAVTIA